MPLKNWSTTPGSNSSAPPFGAPEASTKLKDMNDILRQVMADTRQLAAESSIASAATCDIGANDATFLAVTGVITIASFGTVSAGIYKYLTFDSALTLTHNAVSLILPGGANITTASGDVALVRSLGAGNWKCLSYNRGARFDFAGLSGSATQTFEVAAATVGTHALNRDAGDGRFAPIAYTQRFAEVTANITLSAASSGGFMHITGGIATLPAPADGLRYMIIGKGSGGSVAAPAGSSLVLPDGTSMAAGSLTIAAGTAIEVVARADDTTWTVYNTSGQVITRPGTANNHAVNLGQFASSLAASGYKKYPDINSPSGFCIEQWGTFSLAAAASSTQAITFPIAFPNGLLYPDVSVESAATDMIGTTGRSLTGMTISKGGNDATARTGFWRVFGH